MKKIIAVLLCLAMTVSAFSFGVIANAASDDVAAAGADAEVSSSSATLKSASDFSWDNATVYFLLTDRFCNGNTSNDHAYKRSLNQQGQVVNGNSNAGAFHGGDFAGITKKINEGYFDDLGVTALWISAPYEQAHGYCIAGSSKSNSFPHYSYHGYYALDFSQPDAAFGTEAEFKTMVETAHKHNIRIVLDVVMNHVGYNTIQDMYEYGFGTLKGDWKDKYYNARLTSSDYHNYIDYQSSASDWAKWWGTDWIRAGLAGYTEGSGEKEGSLSYLPDVRTESSKTVDIPAILKTKWSKEGTLSKKQSELNSYFSTGKSKTVRNYLVFWLSQWVEKYGVDGFRCDTAKHVELESWKALKDQCVKSLKTWRSKNPNAPGADWDEDFWMTGECFTHYLNYDSYYTAGGFDSMINFSFNDDSKSFNASGRGVPAANSINATYADYANKLNTNDKFNVLSYISSHDTTLCRNNMIYQGSAFQLLPGAIQIFYGDETNRPLINALEDHNLRSDMNWSSLDKNLLAHWQKVGKFRSNHVAVGAGAHANLTTTSGAAFSRTYNKNGVTDSVAACIGASNNTNVTITVGKTFAEGATVRNAYDGKTATVSGGKVTFNSGANGTILIELDNSVKPTEAPTTEKPTEKPTEAPVTGLFGDADCDGKISVKDATAIQKHVASIGELTAKGKKFADVDGSGTVNIKDATYIQKHLASLEGTAKVGQAYK